MKRILFLPVIAFLLAIFCIGCASTGIKDELIIPPDPDNPFTGTWLVVGSTNYMHIIEGLNGTWYVRNAFSGWKKYAVYTIEQNGNEYITSNHWRISVNGDILTVENMTYERVKKGV